MSKKGVSNPPNYEIKEIIAIVKEYETHDWAKIIAKISWFDNPPTLDIRKMNISQNKPSSGISLTDEEVDKVVDVLVELGYGNIENLKKYINSRENVMK